MATSTQQKDGSYMRPEQAGFSLATNFIRSFLVTNFAIYHLVYLSYLWILIATSLTYVLLDPQLQRQSGW